MYLSTRWSFQQTKLSPYQPEATKDKGALKNTHTHRIKTTKVGIIVNTNFKCKRKLLQVTH